LRRYPGEGNDKKKKKKIKDKDKILKEKGKNDK